jgi:hypothetical protein
MMLQTFLRMPQADRAEQFADPFLRGEATADVIENIIKNILQRRRPELAAFQIVAKVYANFENLSQQGNLQHKGERMKVVQNLTQRFSSANPRFDFVNVAHDALVEKIIGIQCHPSNSQINFQS